MQGLNHIEKNYDKKKLLTRSFLTSKRPIFFNCHQLANSKVSNFEVPRIIPQYISVILLVRNIKNTKNKNKKASSFIKLAYSGFSTENIIMLILEGVYTYEIKRVQVEEENSRRLKITVNYWWLILMQIIHSPENLPKAMSHRKISKKMLVYHVPMKRIKKQAENRTDQCTMLN